MPSIENLSQKKCKPCEGGIAACSFEEATKTVKHLPGWEVAPDGKSIWRNFVLMDFLAAVAFIQKISEVAEAEDHHPDLHLTGYRKLRIELSTHAIGGLSENDFILAAKIEKLPKALKEIK